jgi:hypothetical protein
LANAGELAGDYVIPPIEVPDDLDVTRRTAESLRLNWDVSDPSDGTRDIGTDWANGLTTVVLAVPSAVIARENNYLLNPRHRTSAEFDSLVRSRFISMIGWAAFG